MYAGAFLQTVAFDVLPRQINELGFALDEGYAQFWEAPGRAQPDGSDASADIEKRIAGRRAEFSGNGGCEKNRIDPSTITAPGLQYLDAAAEEGVIGGIQGGFFQGACLSVDFSSINHCPRSACQNPAGGDFIVVRDHQTPG